MKEETHEGRTISFKCCIPKRISKCSDDDLRTSLSTLMNAIANITVCIRRIEHELDKRGTPKSFMKALRANAIPDMTVIDEYFEKIAESEVT
ncbi:MAG: hypothetical protein ACFFF4_09250 [Candidatus Thorarchaeota archaeon]